MYKEEDFIPEDLIELLKRDNNGIHKTVIDAIGIASLFDVEKESRRICVRALIKRTHGKLDILEQDILDALK